MWQAFVAGRGIVQQHRLSSVLLPLVSTPVELGLLGAARSMGIPVALYQHGGFLGNCEHIGWDINDFSLADYSFVYGEGVKRYVLERARKTSMRIATPVAVGSSRVDKLRNGLDEQRRLSIRRKLQSTPPRPLILYVPTNFAGYTRQLCCDSYPDVAYYQMQEEIFRIFAAHREVRLLYKAFVSAIPNPARLTLKSICPSAKWLASPALTTLVWAVDAVIIDLPGTAVLESLGTPARLIVYADRHCLRLREDARILLNKRAQVLETRNEFLQAIEQFLTAGEFGPVPSIDHSFELSYATDRGDGMSAHRALSALEGIARDHLESGAHGKSEGLPISPAGKG